MTRTLALAVCERLDALRSSNEMLLFAKSALELHQIIELLHDELHANS